jgi:uncharacterized protein (TIRG00374 family)
VTGLLRGWWRYGIALAAIGFLIWYVGPAALVATLRGTRPLWLALYLGTFFLVPVLYGVQILGALRLAGSKVPAPSVIAAAVSAWSVGTFTPVRAGDLSLAYFLRGRVPEGDAIAVVSIDKLLSFITLALLAAASAVGLSLPYGGEFFRGAIIALTIAATVLAILCTRGKYNPVRIITRRWVGARVDAARERMLALASVPGVLVWGLIMSAARWLFICGSNVLVFQAVAESPGFGHIIAATAVGRIISLVPVSIGGVGIKEPAQIAIYRATDVPAEAVLAVSVLGLASGFLVAAIAPLVSRALLRAVSEDR